MLSLIPPLVDRIEQAIASGALIELTGLYLGLTVLSLGIERLIRRAIHGEVLVSVPGGRYTVTVLTRCLPSAILSRAHPSIRKHGILRYAVDSNAAYPSLQRVLFQLVPVFEEEGLFRGVPLATALLLDVPAWPAVGVGTVVWAFLHGWGRGLALVLTVGWLLAALWLAGHWYLAIGLHLGVNLAATVLTIWQRSRDTGSRSLAT